ncbi:UPF0692 protein C19orf54 homolog isoform X5 [Heterocephalus glaber]|uniref:Actin maturation protease n=1 Tax=Heterocephalus glaber TaxID=10181 RepID=A0AAX6SEW2_HETGA|nr:UPF0692 protein C19orf54 homolog isoform X5 [Heterocephalus glaber]
MTSVPYRGDAPPAMKNAALRSAWCRRRLPKTGSELGVVASACNPSTQETDAEGSQQIQGQLGLHSETALQTRPCSRFRSDLQWILSCADLPSLIQEGPQCGLVALWMAGALLSPPSGVPLETLVQVAMDRGYTAQGEMFSVADMGRLAQETLGCQAELLRNGLGGPNRDLVLQHLLTGHPLLIPYDEDFNHEPCKRRGHKAHWAVSAGVLLGVQVVPSLGYAEDPELPGLFHPMPSMPCQPPPLPKENTSGTIFLLCKQGKSWHYQLWDYDQVQESNLQLTDFSPSRAADGRDDSHISAALRRRYCFPAHVREEETEPQECKSCAQGHNRARPHPHATWL